MRLVFQFLLILAASYSWPAEFLEADHIQISWLAPRSFGQSGDLIGLRYQMDPNWHIYWKNPGDSGAAPKFNFVSPNIDIGPLNWPIPKRLPVSHLVNLGYEQEVALLFQVTPDKSLKNIHMSVKLEWLVCKESCIPGLGELELNRPVGLKNSDWSASDLEIRNRFSARIPAIADISPWKISSLTASGKQLILQLEPKVEPKAEPKERPSRALEIYPVDGDFVSPQAPKVETSLDRSGFRYIFSLIEGQVLPKKLKFVLVDQSGSSWELDALVELVASVSAGGPVVVNPTTVSSAALNESISNETTGLLSLIFFAFLGGVILNLMPCVLPVLSIKFLSIVKSSEAQRRREALFYTAGVLVTFFSLGAVFLILRAAGSAIGWGFQLQSPVIVLSLILLFWMMSLNFLGYFEFGDSIMNLAGQTGAPSTGESGGFSAFTSGVLAVFVAAPCTGPFMGTALGAAAVLPPAQALGIFVSLGLGLSFPFFLVSYVPAMHRVMPKPGAWMERLKQFLAFPLLGTVIWLMWVLGIQLGTDAWLVSSSALLLMSLAVWLAALKPKYSKWVGVLVAGLTILWSLNFIARARPSSVKSYISTESESSQYGWVKYDRGRIERARTAGQMVFVDFTAAWCITCQVNKKAVLETDKVLSIFKSNNVLIMQADWTNQDPEITKALAEFDRNSVPVYLFYGKNGAKPVILPQILTLNIIENLFAP